MSNKENEEFVYEEEESSSFKKPSTEKLKKKLKKCEEEKKEYLAGWQKSRADLINLRKQDEEEKTQIRKYASEEVINELIPVLDSFNMAISNKEAWETVSPQWRTGVEYIHNQLMDVMERHGLAEINPEGQEFDSAKHEAVETVAGKVNMIVEVIRKGYELNGKIIRAAKVKVGNNEEK